jgi:hypothetical protein
VSEKRYEAVVTYDGKDEGLLNEVMTPSGERWGPVECADLLNQQAETIEVLREWIRHTPINDDFESIDEFERKLIRFQNEGGCGGMEDRVEQAKRRIAALEGE